MLQVNQYTTQGCVKFVQVFQFVSCLTLYQKILIKQLITQVLVLREQRRLQQIIANKMEGNSTKKIRQLSVGNPVEVSRNDNGKTREHTQRIKKNQRPSQNQVVDKLPIQSVDKQLDVDKHRQISSKEAAKVSRKHKDGNGSGDFAIRSDDVTTNVANGKSGGRKAEPGEIQNMVAKSKERFSKIRIDETNITQKDQHGEEVYQVQPLTVLKPRKKETTKLIKQRPLQLNLTDLEPDSSQESFSLLPELHSTSTRRPSLQKLEKRQTNGQRLQVNRGKTQNVNQEDENGDSPQIRQKKALDEFAAAIRDSKESKSPVVISKRKGQISRLSAGFQDDEINHSAFPFLDQIKKVSLKLLRSPMSLSPTNVINLGIISDVENQVSRNYPVITPNKTSLDSKHRGENKSQFKKFSRENFNSANKSREHDVKSDRPDEQRRSPRKSPNKLKEVEIPMLEMLSVSQTSQSMSSSESKKQPITDDKQKYRSRYDVTEIAEPLPILRGGTYQDEPEAVWKKRRLKQNLAVVKLSAAEAVLQFERDEFEKAQRALFEERKKVDQKLQLVQERLAKKASNIRVTSNLNIPLADYPQYFKYKIYEAFKPTDLRQTRNYLEYLTTDTDSTSCTVSQEDLSPELYNYLSKDMETKLPSYIKQTKLLQFDSNFESGNLDSAYLVNDIEYNLLCKVDTNTKGNTYWFYFKVLNWKPKAQATFNVLNVARDLVPFYSKGMQIWTRCESTNGKYKSDWECSENVRVVSFQPNDIVRSTKQRKEYAMGRNYHTLKFRCEFPEIPMLKTAVQSCFDDTASVNGYAEVGPNDQGAPGTVFCFAYALPYTYTDLMSDLLNCKKFLLKNSGIIVNELNQTQAPKKLHTKAKPAKLEETSPVENGGDEDGLMTPVAPSKIQRRFQQQDEDRTLLTKNQIAQRELKKEALKFVKERMGRFEIQLLKADEETKQVIKNRRNFQKGPKLLEIHTDYLYFKQEIISQSVGGLNLYQITLTKRKGPNCVPYHKKKCVYITARMHSAETCSSFIMKSIMQELVTKAEKYDSILSNYIVKLVPLINPDGVTIGNSRSSLVGLDLNRRWAEPNASIHPEIYFLKKIMQQQANSQQGISIFCDLHGHNRKENCFFYGCNKAADEGMLSWTKTRLLPKIMASVEQIFDFSSCKFRQDKFKLNTARVVVWNEMKVTNSFTLETSMFAKTVNKIPLEAAAAITSSINSMESKKELRYIQLKMSDLHQIAKSFLVSCAQYSKLEKEIEKECSLQYGWFKPSKLNEFGGEAARDKQKREATQKSKAAIKDKVRDITRKQSERLVSSFAEPARRRVTKLNSGNKVLSPDSKISTTNVIVRPKAKRQQSLINIVQGMQGSNEKSKEKNGPNNLNVHFDEIPEKSQTSKKLKGPKVLAIQQEIAENGQINEAGQSSVVTKLKSWKEFFDVEEFQKGIAQMKKALTNPLTELSEEASSGSDSEPSIDNFDQQELQDNLCEALDLQEGDPDPFETPFPMKNKEPSVKPSEPSEEEDLLSMEDMRDRTEVMKEAPTTDYEFSDQQLSSVLPTPAEFQFENPSSNGMLVQIYTGRRQQIYEQNPRNLDKSARYHQQARAQNSRQASLSQNMEQERLRIQNYPDLANQLINQLILQQNARQMKASAAPPSGIEKNSTNQIKPNEFAQNHVLRGFSCVNPDQNITNHVSATKNTSPPEQTKYFTEQHRRMIVQRSPTTQFTVLGQGVSSLNNSTIQDNTIVSARKKARKVQQSTIKVLTPLLTPQQLVQHIDEFGSQGKLACTQDSRADAHQKTKASRTIFNSESRQTSRVQHNYAAGNGVNIFINNSQTNSSRQASCQKGSRTEHLRIEKSFENTLYRNQMNESQRTASSKNKKPKSIRGSSEKRIQKNKDNQKLVLEQQRLQEAHKHYEQQQQILGGQYHIKLKIDQVTGNVSYDSSLDNRQTLEMRKQQNREKFPNNGRYSQVRKNFTEGTEISPTLASQQRGVGDFQLYMQHANSPMQQDGLRQNQATLNQLSPQHHVHKISFKTPRYLKLVQPVYASNTVGRPPLGEFDDYNQIPQARSSNVTRLIEQDMSQIESQGNQTWYSGSGFVDSSTNRAASSSNRKMSHMNPSVRQRQFVMAVNGFELHKDLVMRSIKYNPLQDNSTENRMALDQQEMPASDKAFINRQGSRISNSQMPSARANERVTPIIGNGLNKQQVKIINGRNLRHFRPDSLEQSGQFVQTFGGTIDDLKKLKELTENKVLTMQTSSNARRHLQTDQ